MNAMNKTVGALRTNQLEENSLKNITGLNIKVPEIDKEITSTKLDIGEILREGSLIPIELAQEAIQISNKVDKLVSMSIEEQKAEQITMELAEQFKPYGKKALNILKGINPFPNIKSGAADDYNYAMAA